MATIDLTGSGIGPEVYLAIIMLMMVVLMMGVFMFAPFIPYATCSLRKSKMLGLVDRTRQVKLSGADLRNGMYYFNNKPWRFVKQYPGTFWFGKGVPFELVHVDLGFVQDPYMNAAVEELREKYGIENYLELQDAIDRGEIDKEEEILVPLFFRVPMDSLITYGAVVPPSDITGEVEDLVEDRKGEMATFKKLIPYALFFVMVVVGGALAYAMITSM